MDPVGVRDSKALVLSFFLFFGISMIGVVPLIVGQSPPEMEPDTYRQPYMSEEDWLSWFQEQRKKLVSFTAGPPIIAIAIFFFMAIVFFRTTQIKPAGGY